MRHQFNILLYSLLLFMLFQCSITRGHKNNGYFDNDYNSFFYYMDSTLEEIDKPKRRILYLTDTLSNKQETIIIRKSQIIHFYYSNQTGNYGVVYKEKNVNYTYYTVFNNGIIINKGAETNIH